jgi:hypothetical protein
MPLPCTRNLTCNTAFLTQYKHNTAPLQVGYDVARDKSTALMTLTEIKLSRALEAQSRTQHPAVTSERSGNRKCGRCHGGRRTSQSCRTSQERQREALYTHRHAASLSMHFMPNLAFVTV